MEPFLFIVNFFVQCVAILLSVLYVGSGGEERSLYLVLMDGAPLALVNGASKNAKLEIKSESSRAHANYLVDSHTKLLQSALESDSYNKLYSFIYTINGFAVHTTPSQAEKLKNARGVKLVEKDRGARLTTTYTPHFLKVPQEVWTMKGGDKSAGEGIVIGVVDTGINPNHPSFGNDDLIGPFTSNTSRFRGACETGPGFSTASCNGKIVSARYFSAGARAVATLNSSVDLLSPCDADGHGSHVASVAAGNTGVPVVVDGFYYGRASGMAPRARIAVYKAVYPTVGTLTDVVAAIDQVQSQFGNAPNVKRNLFLEAAMDRVDVLALSVGPDEPPEDTLTFLSVFDVAMLMARQAGVFVAQAAGNHGPAPASVVSYSPWAMGVASCNMDRTYPGSLHLGNGRKVGGVGLSGPTFGYGSIMYKVVLAQDALLPNGTFQRTPEECQNPEALDPVVVRGSIVICTFSAGFYNGTSTVASIINTATSLGFLGFALLANPTYGDFIAEPIPFAVSGILVPKVDDAKIVLEYYEQRTKRDDRGVVVEFRARASIGEGRIASLGGRAPVVSRLSSRGPDFMDANLLPADVLKPDILAPGHQIWAAWSPLSASEPLLAGNMFALFSGTSMATPHIAGIAALIKQHNPSWTPAMIASAISMTATKYDGYGEVIKSQGYDLTNLSSSTYFDFGAGLVNPELALDPGLVLPTGYEDYIRFLCSLPNVNHTVIELATGTCCNGTFGHLADLNLPSVTISALKGSLTIRRTFYNVGDKQETYSCSVIPPNGTKVEISPTWFTILPKGSQDLYIQFGVVQVATTYSFGELVLTGSLNHIVRMPLSVLPISLY